jgi:hypothetical protein
MRGRIVEAICKSPLQNIRRLANLEMLDLTPLFEFSRSHCVAICAVLVPANLLATLQTLIMVGLHRPTRQVQIIVWGASFYAVLMIAHVGTWLMIGVVMLPTFVLLGLGLTCLGLNAWAIAQTTQVEHFLNRLKQFYVS